MDQIRISKDQAKRFLVRYHGLHKRSTGEESDIIDFIKKVGCIQFDPLNVVGRNADLVLQSRFENYREAHLYKLLYEERMLVDGWDKMMSIYHIGDWNMMSRVREAHSEANINVMRNRGSLEALSYLEHMKDILREEGPRFAREINVGGREKGRWSSTKYANVALDHLFHLGEIGIKRKKNNQKQFDLIHNILDERTIALEDIFESDEQFYKWYIVRRIGSVGMLWGKSGGAWLGHFLSNKKLRCRVIEKLVEENKIIPVEIDGIKEPFYVKADDVDMLVNDEKNYRREIRFLAPLDNILWDRSIVEKVFDFKYSWEVYVPKDKRKYGYYVIPVMLGENIIARFEPEKHKEGEVFRIKNWWWEDGVEITPELLKSIDDEMKIFCRYLNASNLRVDIT